MGGVDMKALSNTKLKVRRNRKTNPSITETVELARKNAAWAEVAKRVSGPTRAQGSINLFQLENKTKAGDTVAFVGKVLSKGDLKKKIVICALSISDSAREKLKDSKSEFRELKDEIAKNPKMEGVTLL